MKCIVVTNLKYLAPELTCGFDDVLYVKNSEIIQPDVEDVRYLYYIEGTILKHKTIAKLIDRKEAYIITPNIKYINGAEFKFIDWHITLPKLTLN